MLMHVLILSMDAISASKSFPDNSIQLNLISLSQLHNPQEGILSSWSMVGSIQRTTEEDKSECLIPREEGPRGWESRLLHKQGPAQVARFALPKARTMGRNGSD